MKIYIAYYSVIYDDNEYSIDWSKKEIINAYSTLKLLNEKVKDEILKLDGNPFFFTPSKEQIFRCHPTKNVFSFNVTDARGSYSYVWDYQEVNLITELDIFK